MKTISITIITFSLLLTSAFVGAEEQELKENIKLVISELQTGDVSSASNEFIEIANTSSLVLDLSGVSIEYKSRTGTSWTKKADLEGSIVPYGRFLVANYEISDDYYQFGGGLAGSGGHIQLVAADESVIDKLAWGEAIDPDGEATPAAASTQVLKRIVDEDGYFVDSDNNFEDFILSESPTPTMDRFSEVETEVIEEDESEDDSQPPVDISTEIENTEQTEAIGVNHPIRINELVPDPVKPLVDSDHEMVELFNPNAFAVELAGYRLEAGKDWRYSYEFPSLQLLPGEYFSVFSEDTSLTLSNSGSEVRLVTSGGSEVSRVIYEKAKPGLAWANIGGKWEWVNPTPNSANIKVEESAVEPVQSDEGEPATLGAKNIDYPIQSQEAESPESSATSFAEDQADEDAINPLILAGVGVFALTYILYEYRNEIRTYIKQLRGYVANRRKDRQEA